MRLKKTRIDSQNILHKHEKHLSFYYCGIGYFWSLDVRTTTHVAWRYIRLLQHVYIIALQLFKSPNEAMWLQLRLQDIIKTTQRMPRKSQYCLICRNLKRISRLACSELKMQTPYLNAFFFFFLLNWKEMSLKMCLEIQSNQVEGPISVCSTHSSWCCINHYTFSYASVNYLVSLS